MFLKLAQLLMVAAILNPFCCCTAAVAAGTDAGNTPAVPGCCQSGGQSTAPDGSEHHDPANCPHAALKDYQNTFLKDASTKELPGQGAPVLVALIEPSDLFLKPLAQGPMNRWYTRGAPAPPRALRTFFCVYRI